MLDPQTEPKVSSNDARLIEEAMARLRFDLVETSIGRDAMIAVLTSELSRGKRDIFSLVKAGRRAIDG